MPVREFAVSHSIEVLAPAQCVWSHVTAVDIASLRHPAYLSALGFPKPLRSEIIDAREGGTRIAYFDNGKRFTQEITSWNPVEEYSFTFQPDPGFRIGYFLNLAEGPFRIKLSTYTIAPLERGVRVRLTIRYELHGVFGICLHPPVWFSMTLFQNY